MSSVVCQGLQSCLEPRFVETFVSRQKFSPPKPDSPSQSYPCPQKPSALRHQQEHQENSDTEEEKSNEDGKSNNTGELGGWSFIQALTGTSHNRKEVTEKEKVYVHPLVKRSSSTLSFKSLEMCTESLGSETGSDISERNDEFSLLSSLSLNSENSHETERSKPREFTKKLSRSHSFPPPLTSISGSDSVRVRPHREGGRLVIEAVTIASRNACFQTERVDGRLRLCLARDGSLSCDSYGVVEGKEKVYNEEVDEGVGETKAAGEYFVHGGGGGGGGGGEDGEDDDKWVEGIGELPRPSRCKEGGGTENKAMSSLGPFWVAIS